VGLEPTISESQRAETVHALDRAAVTGFIELNKDERKKKTNLRQNICNAFFLYVNTCTLHQVYFAPSSFEALRVIMG
jgi:hypothetical protein